MYHVLVQGLELHAYHGVPDAEREIGHRYVIDLKLDVEGKAFETDDVAETVDYAAAGKTAQDVAENQQFRTVERLARVIGEAIVAQFPLVEAADVTVRKPLPPAPMLAAFAGVSVRTQRDPR